MNRRVAIINLSRKHYNLGAYKLQNWFADQGDLPIMFDGDPGFDLHLGAFDLVALSAIFSWDVPLGADIAFRMKGHAEIWAGGPGFYGLQNWWFEKTGMTPTLGLDPRFEKQRGVYRMTFASRGCTERCSFCIVWRFEGNTFTLDRDFQPAPILCDNNLSALPVDFQEHIIRRYQDACVPLLDANSGFEPHSFDAATYERWRPVLRGPWRCGLDDTPETAAVENMLQILAPVRRRNKRVYVLIGNEPIAECYARAWRVVELGAEPFCQPETRLYTLTKDPIVKHDWTARRLTDFARYFNRFYWKRVPLQSYDGDRLERPTTFAGFDFKWEKVAG